MNQFGYMIRCIEQARLGHCPPGLVVVNVPEPLLAEIWDTIKYNMPPTWTFEQFRDRAISGKQCMFGARLRVVTDHQGQGITIAYDSAQLPDSVDCAALDIMLAQLGIAKEVS